MRAFTSVSTARLRPLEGTIFSVTIAGPRLVTDADLAAHAGDPRCASCTTTRQVVEVVVPGFRSRTAEIQFLRSTTLVEDRHAAIHQWRVVEPATRRRWTLRVPDNRPDRIFHAYAKSGQVGITRLHSPRYRRPNCGLTPTNGELQIALGANRWFGIRTNSLTDQQIQA